MLFSLLNIIKGYFIGPFEIHINQSGARITDWVTVLTLYYTYAGFVLQLERTYQSKFDALVIRERHATERLQREQEVKYDIEI